MQEIFGQHGWKEFHRNRKNILDEYQKFIDLSSNRPVQVAHGNAGEAYIRKWLSEFLPKKYGVTSGYVIPDLYNDERVIYHFDIIIYNQLDSPILWTEGNQDSSEQGKIRAIPAKYVAAIFEVKSRITIKNSNDALQKLKQVEIFKDQLQEKYFSGIFFIELKESENNSRTLLSVLHEGKNITGFTGGIVLRYEMDESAVGVLSLSPLSQPLDKDLHNSLPLAKKIDDLNIFTREDNIMVFAEGGAGMDAIAISEQEWAITKTYATHYYNENILLTLQWSRSNFSNFCVDLLRRLEGRAYDDKKKSSFGAIFDTVREELAPPQSATPLENHPFLKMSILHDGTSKGNYTITNEGSDSYASICIAIKNEGSKEATISEDGFKSKFQLPIGSTFKKNISAKLPKIDEKQKSSEYNTKFSVKGMYRIVYTGGPNGDEIFSLAKIITINNDIATIEDISNWPNIEINSK